jgi:hypothetical protein
LAEVGWPREEIKWHMAHYRRDTKARTHNTKASTGGYQRYAGRKSHQKYLLVEGTVTRLHKTKGKQEDGTDSLSFLENSTGLRKLPVNAVRPGSLIDFAMKATCSG